MLDVDTDDFEMRSPIQGLDGQPLLSFKEITEAGPFVAKFTGFAKFAYACVKAGRHKVHMAEAQAHGLTEDDIAMIFLYTPLFALMFVERIAHVVVAGTRWRARFIAS